MTFEQFVAAMVAHFGADADQFVGSDMHDQYGIWDYSDGGRFGQDRLARRA